jgi:parallel beta-helix repeat protein
MEQPSKPNPAKPRHALFISYSSEDQETAEALCAALEADGIRCWIAPRDVKGGRPYSGQITQAIRESRVLLLLLSVASNMSKQVLREVERAAHCQNFLLTFRIELLTPGDDLAYFLGADHWVDGFRPLPPSQHFPVLIRHARELLETSFAVPPDEDQPDAPEKETFAHFRILRRPDGSIFRLGKGGMGVTYKAVDTVLNRPVALKVIASELLRAPHAKHRFKREARAAALIQHPNVATIFHFGEEGDACFYTMEFVEGEDLERYVAREGPLKPAAVLRVALQVAQALEAAQARQLVHRDIKPSNIMAVADRAGALNIKLIDFGLAKGAGAESLDASRVTRTQDFVGSPAFASPEQCETRELDVRSDIYSLGVTLWYLLLGKRLFSGTVGEVMIAHVVKPPPFDQLAHVPLPVNELLRRMLAKNPEERYQSPQELQDAVETASARLASEREAAPEPIATERSESTDHSGIDRVVPEESTEPVGAVLMTSPLFENYFGVEVGAMIAGRYRLVQEETEGNGGRLFLAHDDQAAAAECEVGLKVLHPGIASDPGILDLLENELEVIQKANHPGLVRYFCLEHSTPFLVREWIHGFVLYDLLRWRRSLNAAELQALLGPLAATLDFVSERGLGLVEVSIRKIFLEWPKEVRAEEFPNLARANAEGWKDCSLKVNPLSLAPLLFRSRSAWDRQTIVPASRVLSMTQTEAGIRGSKAVRLYGRLVYELLNGHGLGKADSQAYRPLPELNQAANETLRRACMAGSGADPYRNCQQFWNALEEKMAARTAGAPIPPTTAPTIAPRAPPPKRSWIVGAILAGALIIGLAILAVNRFGNPGQVSPAATPSPSIVAVTPTPSVALPTPTPLTIPSTTPLVSTNPPAPPTQSPTASTVVVIPSATTPVPALSSTPIQGVATLLVPDRYPTIQAAIDAAKAGDTILVKAGVYNEALRFKDGIELRGDNRDTTVVRFSSPDTAIAGGSHTEVPLMVRNCGVGTIRNISFQQAATDKSKDAGAYKPPAVIIFNSSVKLTSCAATSVGGSGIVVSGDNSDTELSDNRCKSSKYSGILFKDGARGKAINNVCDENGHHGIAVEGAGTEPELERNECRRNQRCGIAFVEGGGGKAEQNSCEDNTWAGIGIANSGSNPELLSNRCRSNRKAGIYFRDNAGGSAERNICENNSWSGIMIDNSSPYISDNELVKNANFGLAYDSPSKPRFGKNNRYTGNLKGEILRNAIFN